MKIKINIDNELAEDAQAIYDALGLDMESAIKMFLKRTVLEHRLPLDTTVPGNDNAPIAPDTAASSKRTNNVITKTMAEDIWERFVRYLNGDGDISSAAADAHATTGMNQGSAFIYLTILDNFVNGKHNTRNMKMADLEYYVLQIRSELDRQSYLNTIKSLKLSIPYWNKGEFGQFADKVSSFVQAMEGGDADFVGENLGHEREVLPITLLPSDQDQFKRQLMTSGKGLIRIYYTDGTSKEKEWNASNISETSNIINNLRSRAEFRSGEWQKNGISSVQAIAL